eukprot:sb/3464368/
MKQLRLLSGDLMTFTPDNSVTLIHLTPEMERKNAPGTEKYVPSKQDVIIPALNNGYTGDLSQDTLTPNCSAISHLSQQPGDKSQQPGTISQQKGLISQQPEIITTSELSNDGWTTSDNNSALAIDTTMENTPLANTTINTTLPVGEDNDLTMDSYNNTSSIVEGNLETTVEGQLETTVEGQLETTNGTSSPELDLSQDLDALIARLRQMNTLAARTADQSSSLEATPNLFENTLISTSVSPCIVSPPSVVRTARSTHEIGSAFSPPRSQRNEVSPPRSQRKEVSPSRERSSSPGKRGGGVKRDESPVKRRDRSPPKSAGKSDIFLEKNGAYLQKRDTSPPKRDASLPKREASLPKRDNSLPKRDTAPPKQSEPRSPPKPQPLAKVPATSRSPDFVMKPVSYKPKPVTSSISDTNLENRQPSGGQHVGESTDSEKREMIVRFLSSNPHYVQHLDSGQARSLKSAALSLCACR